MSRIDALRAMAAQDVSPNERDIARAKLEAMGAGAGEPPHRPPSAAAPSPDGQRYPATGTVQFGSGYATGTFTFVFTTSVGANG